MGRASKLLIALILGAICGSIAHYFTDSGFLVNFNTHILQPVGQIFLRMIFMVVVPLLFSALVLGVLELSQGIGLGRIAGKTLFYTLIASMSSVLIGIGLVSFFKPGMGIGQILPNLADSSTAITQIQKNVENSKPISQVIVELIPKNPFEAAVNALNGDILALMFFALIFGLAMGQLRKTSTNSTLVRFFEDLYGVSLKIIDYAMHIAPFGIFALVFNSVFRFGFEVLSLVMVYAVLVVLGLLIQQFVVYAALLKWVGKRSPWEFFKNCKEVYLYAFSTASSNATLPKSLEAAELKLKLPPKIARFVLTIGATANQNGTALFEGVTVLFLAQVYSIDLTFVQQVQVVLMSILAGVGTAGVPGGSLPLIAILLQSLGIPVEGIGLILGIDRLLDMCRTTLNVSGDLVIAALVSANEPDSAT